MTISQKTLFLPGLALAAALVQPSVTLAQETVLNECARQWVAATSNPKFFQPWPEYYDDCKKKLDADAAAKTADSAPTPQPEAKKAEPPPAAPAPAAAAPPPAPAPAATPAQTPAKPAKPAHKPAKKPVQH